MATGGTINYYKNDGSSVYVSYSTYDNGPTPKTISEIGWSRSGYEFVNWNTSSDGTGTIYGIDTPAPSSGTTNLYAIWEALPDIDITYKGSSIATMSASGTKTLETEGKYCEDDITITYTKPSVSPNIQSLNVTANGTYTASGGVDGYSPVTVNVSGGSSTSVTKKQINFIDYDGTLLHSYTKAEINAMTSESDLPANPSHTGLTAQGWNWTLAQIKAQLTAAPDGDVWVGQMYVTESGDTEIDVELHAPRLSPYLGLATDGTVEVDWGDGTAKSTVTGTSLTTQIRKLHTYADEEPRTISIHKVSGSYTLYGSSTYGILSGNSSTASNNMVYANEVKNVRIGNNVTSIGNYAFKSCASLASVAIPNSVTSINGNAFDHCYSLASVTIPNNVTSIGMYAFYVCPSLASVAIPNSVTSINGNAFNSCASLASVTIPNSVTSIKTYMFDNCYSLASVTIPNNVTSIGTYAFYDCSSLASVTIPNNVTSIGNYAFNSCASLASVTIPNNVTSIGIYAFGGCNGLGSIHFKSSTPPAVSNSNAWTGVPTDCIIYVPSGKLSDYTGASNYPSSSTYTYVEE